MNAIVESGAILSVLKAGIVVSVYKGGAKDPLKVDSFRGVTLTSILAKVLEFLIVERLQSFLLEAGLPHINQSAYQRGVSCAQAIFATQETIAQYMHGGSKVYMCLYDLEKAFDSVEFSVLLHQLFTIGINGKLWRLLRDWYSGMSCSVRLDGCKPEDFGVMRGIRQGSVLSPLLFHIVIDPLLQQLERSALGPSINNLYAGGYLHADFGQQP